VGLVSTAFPLAEAALSSTLLLGKGWMVVIYGAVVPRAN